MSIDYPSYSLSLVKISARTVKVLLSNDDNIVWDEYKNAIIFLSFVYFYSLFSQYLEKGKNQHGFLIDSESSKKGLQNHILFDLFRGDLC